MNKSILLAFLIILLVSKARAQSDTFETSEMKINKGIDAFENQDYKTAIALFSSIHYGDSLYPTARYELGLTYSVDSQYSKALYTYQNILGKTYSIRRDLILAIGNTYSMMGEYDKAFSYYDSAKMVYPHDNRPYYESAVVHFKDNDIEKAIAQLEQSALINPYHFRTHWLLSYAYATQGRLSESFLASVFALSQSYNSSMGNNALSILANIAQVSSSYYDNYNNKTTKHKLFDEIDELIVSKIALSKDYKVVGKLDNIITRQLQLIVEKLEFEKTDPNFSMQYYVPLIEQIVNNNLYQDFLLYIFSDLEIDEVDKLTSGKKAKSQLGKINDVFFIYNSHILGTRQINYTKRTFDNIRYVSYPKEQIFIEGKPLNEEFKQLTGKVKIYKNFELLSEGNYNTKGEKEGLWKYYHQNGKLSLEETIKNGHTRNKEKKRYNTNGYLITHIIYDDKNEFKSRTDYFNTGKKSTYQIVNKVGNYVYTTYYANGQEKSTLVYAKDKENYVVDGEYKTFHANGKVKSTFMVKNNKRHGAYNEYYDNGNISLVATYSDGELHGKYISYYEDGKIDVETQYANGKRNGLLIERDEESNAYYTENYKNGLRDGETIFYNDQQQPYGSKLYNKEMLIAYRYTDAKGNILAEERNDKGIYIDKRFNKYGTLHYIRTLNKNNEFDGKVEYYYINGKLKSLEQWKNDEQDGEQKYYNDKGQLKTVRYYKNGEENGIYKRYYDNGKLERIGDMVDGKAWGRWVKYHENGEVYNTYFIEDGNVKGNDSFFYYNGKLKYVYYYNNTILVGVAEYDTNGVMYNNSTFNKGNGKIELHYKNGNVKYTVPIERGFYNGKYIGYSSNKTKIEEYEYDMGRLINGYKLWYANGVLRAEGQYVNYQLNGIIKYYDELGKIKEIVSYKDGELDGENIIYQNGRKTREYNYMNGYKNGKATFYGDNETVMVYLFYENDNIIGYAYLDENGKETAMIPANKGNLKAVAYYPNGSKSFEAEWKDCYLHNSFRTYFTNGKVCDESNYVIGNLKGVSKKWNSEGVLIYEATYKDGKIDGKLIRYDDKGDKFLELNYIDNKLHGKQLMKDTQGKFVETFYCYDSII